MRRAMPTRPLWPLNNSQSANPAALAIALTRRAICDSDSPRLFRRWSTPLPEQHCRIPVEYRKWRW